jgi:hypothetical protein
MSTTGLRLMQHFAVGNSALALTNVRLGGCDDDSEHHLPELAEGPPPRCL